ncbi:hypothetical protein ACP4OV_027203 [Aristida adscensionis]
MAVGEAGERRQPTRRGSAAAAAANDPGEHGSGRRTAGVAQRWWPTRRGSVAVQRWRRGGA